MPQICGIYATGNNLTITIWGPVLVLLKMLKWERKNAVTRIKIMVHSTTLILVPFPFCSILSGYLLLFEHVSLAPVASSHTGALRWLIEILPQWHTVALEHIKHSIAIDTSKFKIQILPLYLSICLPLSILLIRIIGVDIEEWIECKMPLRPKVFICILHLS